MIQFEYTTGDNTYVIDVDESTNMPSTPEEYFWEINEEYGRYWVSLKKKQKFWFSKTIKTTRFSMSEFVSEDHEKVSAEKFAAAAFKTACYISVTYLDDIRKQRAASAEWEKIHKMYGKYPPKKLYN